MFLCFTKTFLRGCFFKAPFFPNVHSKTGLFQNLSIEMMIYIYIFNYVYIAAYEEITTLLLVVIHKYSSAYIILYLPLDIEHEIRLLLNFIHSLSNILEDSSSLISLLVVYILIQRQWFRCFCKVSLLNEFTLGFIEINII